jgi:hypothetical protein
MSLADDVASMDEHDDMEMQSDAESTDVDSHCSDEQEFMPPMYPDDDPTAESTNLTATASFRADSDPIVFHDPEEWSGEYHEPGATRLLKHTLYSINNPDPERPTRDIAPGMQGEVLRTVHLTVGWEGLDHKGPFRVLYVGASEFKGAVLDKLGDILIANPNNASPSSSVESSRFHVVPTNFGPGSAPSSAELLPLNVQLAVDECTATYEDQEDPSRLTLILKNGNRYTSSRDGSKNKISSTSEWVPPDVAIFFLTNSDTDAEMSSRHRAYYFMVRHGIPCLFISETPAWTRGDRLLPVNPRSLHVALETYDHASNQVRVLGRVPVDLDTFERISPEQLNKNLAAFLGPRESDLKPSEALRTKTEVIRDIEKCQKVWKEWDSARPVVKTGESAVLGNTLVFLIGLATLVMGYAVLKQGIMALSQILSFCGCMLWSQCNNSSLSPSSTAPITVPAIQSVAIAPWLTSTTDMTVPIRGGGKSLSINDYITEISRPIAEKPNESQNFEVHVIGDCHLVIKTPTTGRRKNPKFRVKVTRAETELQFELSRLFDGVYSLRLAREDAYGLIKVNITTKTKPVLDQVTEVDFGTPWLKIASWKRAAQALSFRVVSDLNSAQVGLLEAYNRVAPDIQTVTNTLREEVNLAGAPFKRALGSAEKMAQKSKRLYEDMRRGAGWSIDPALLLRIRERAEFLHQSAVGYFSAALGEMNDQAKRVQHLSFKQKLSHLRRRAREFSRFRSLAAAQQHAYELVHWRRWQSTVQCETRRGRGTSCR